MSDAERQSLVSVNGLPGLWATTSGGEISAAVTQVWNGGASSPENLAAPAVTSDFMVDRPYDADTDQGWVRNLKTQVGRWRTTLTIVETDADLIPIGQPTVYAASLLNKLTPPNYDASSGKEKRIALTFSVTRAA